MIWVQSSAPGREKSPRSSIPLWGDLGAKMCQKWAAKTRGLEIVHVQISGYFMVFIMFYRLYSTAISWCVHPACWDKQSGTQHDTSQKRNNPVPFSSTLRFKSCKSDGQEPRRMACGFAIDQDFALKPLAMVLTRVSRRVIRWKIEFFRSSCTPDARVFPLTELSFVLPCTGHSIGLWAGHVHII